MPIFKIEVVTVITRTSEIVVEAKSLKEALKYAKTNTEWYHETDNPANEIQSYTKIVPVAGKAITHISELPLNYDGDTVPWNTTTNDDFDKIFRTIPTDILNGEISKMFDLSVRTAHALKLANINFIGQLVAMSDADLLKLKNFGRKGLGEIKAKLAYDDLTTGMTFDWKMSDEQRSMKVSSQYDQD